MFGSEDLTIPMNSPYEQRVNECCGCFFIHHYDDYDDYDV